MSNIHSSITEEEYTKKWSPEIETEIKNIIKRALSKSYTSTYTIFDYIEEQFLLYYEKPCSNMIELKKRNKKQTGDIFEHFCILYLKAKGYGECYLIGDTPEDVLNILGLKRRDMGIDIIIKHDNGYFAVQAKWRTNKHKSQKIGLSWAKLSTFYALCARSGPYLKYLVITNADYVKRIGKSIKWIKPLQNKAFGHVLGNFGVKLLDMKAII